MSRYLNLKKGDVANALTSGETGAIKTTLTQRIWSVSVSSSEVVCGNTFFIQWSKKRRVDFRGI